jgi:hypothetical protein
VRTSAFAETGHADKARAVFDAELAGKPVARDHHADTLARLAEARLRTAEGDRAGAEALLARLVNDIRAGSGIRERAQALLEQSRKN